MSSPKRVPFCISGGSVTTAPLSACLYLRALIHGKYQADAVSGLQLRCVPWPLIFISDVLMLRTGYRVLVCNAGGTLYLADLNRVIVGEYSRVSMLVCRVGISAQNGELSWPPGCTPLAVTAVSLTQLLCSLSFFRFWFLFFSVCVVLLFLPNVLLIVFRLLLLFLIFQLTQPNLFFAYTYVFVLFLLLFFRLPFLPRFLCSPPPLFPSPLSPLLLLCSFFIFILRLLFPLISCFLILVDIMHLGKMSRANEWYGRHRVLLPGNIGVSFVASNRMKAYVPAGWSSLEYIYHGVEVCLTANCARRSGNLLF